MGLFDSVMVPCPKCGASVEFQHKDDDSGMRVYSLEDAPTYILTEILNEPEYCERCGQWFALIDPDFPPGAPPRPKPSIVRVRTPDNPTTHPQGMKWWPDADRFSYADVDEADRPAPPPAPRN